MNEPITSSGGLINISPAHACASYMYFPWNPDRLDVAMAIYYGNSVIGDGIADGCLVIFSTWAENFGCYMYSRFTGTINIDKVTV